MIELVSFSYKRRSEKLTSAAIDCRVLRNPYKYPKLRHLTGRHPEVQKYVAVDPEFDGLVKLALRRVEEGSQRLCFGCFGGHHRSVAMVEKVAGVLLAAGKPVTKLHLELEATER